MAVVEDVSPATKTTVVEDEDTLCQLATVPNIYLQMDIILFVLSFICCVVSHTIAQVYFI